MSNYEDEPKLKELDNDELFELQRRAASELYSEIDDWQTRLLLVQPGHYGEPIDAEMHNVDLLHGPGVVLSEGKRRREEYTALSYCWGEPRFDRSIQCNSVPFPLTDNLYCALQRLRSPRKVLRLWVDALCINQHNTAERSMQVANICTIFSKAKSVVAWVGENSTYTDLALRHLGAAQISEQPETEKVRELNKNDFDKETFAPEHEIEAEQFGLMALFQRPWFRRVWVKQEVFAAETLFLQCGSRRIAWDDLPDVMLPTFLRKNVAINAQLAFGERENPFLDDDVVEEEDDDFLTYETDIINISRRASGSQCSDPRDCVYGLLGMSTASFGAVNNTGAELYLIVDYGKTIAKVFQDLACYIMRRDKVMNILYLSASFGTTMADSTLASWVPDWSLPTDYRPWLQYCSRFLFDGLAEFQPDDMQADVSDRGALEALGFTVGEVIHDFTEDDDGTAVQLVQGNDATLSSLFPQWLGMQFSSSQNSLTLDILRSGINYRLLDVDCGQAANNIAQNIPVELAVDDRMKSGLQSSMIVGYEMYSANGYQDPHRTSYPVFPGSISLPSSLLYIRRSQRTIAHTIPLDHATSEKTSQECFRTIDTGKSGRTLLFTETKFVKTSPIRKTYTTERLLKRFSSEPTEHASETQFAGIRAIGFRRGLIL